MKKRAAFLALAMGLLSFAAGNKSYNIDGVAPGSIRFKWIHGSVCAANNRDPRIQVVAYNEDTFILRQNIAVHWEAPFTYLLVGNQRALLIGTGATPEAAFYPLRKTVDGLLRRITSVRRVSEIPLVLAHTSQEDVAQNQGAAQFEGRAEMFRKGETIDLGGRQIQVLPTPGTHKDGVTFYDRTMATCTQATCCFRAAS